MFAKVYRLWEEGRQLPRSQIGRLESKMAHGELRISEWRDDLLNRNMRCARLFEVNSGQKTIEPIPTLLDATVLWIKDNQMTITGFERDPVFTKAYPQSWLVELLVDSKDMPSNAHLAPKAPVLWEK